PVDGSDERVLATRHTPDFFRSAAWSPDGTEIACSAGTRSEAKEMTVVRVGAETGVEKPLAARRWRSIGRLAWTRDGRGLLMDASLDNTKPSQIWSISSADGASRQITSGLDTYHGVSMTSDSKRLVTLRTNQIRNIWVWPSGDGTAARQVTSGTGKAEHPCWTPEGRLVYSAEAGASRNIWIMDPDGRSQKQLTFDSDLDDQPAVSADGKYFVYV